MNDTLEHTARQIAEQGREALLARLRPAFKEVAAAHADVLELDDEKIEQMVQRAADRADGLQWRRALAAVASEQLGIGLGEALGHPAVARAQAIIGAPSYEESLAKLGPLGEPPVAGAEQPARDEDVAADQAEAVAADQAEAVAADQAKDDAHDRDHEPSPDELEATAGPQPAETPTAASEPDRATPPADVEPRAEFDDPERDPDKDDDELDDELDEEGEEDEEEDTDDWDEFDGEELEPTGGSADSVRLRATHLGGIANLSSPEHDIELRFSDLGLDIIRPNRQPLGRLTWPELRALEVPPARTRLRRKRPPNAHLVIRSRHGDASFEIPGVTPEELRKHLSPMRKLR